MYGKFVLLPKQDTFVSKITKSRTDTCKSKGTENVMSKKKRQRKVHETLQQKLETNQRESLPKIQMIYIVLNMNNFCIYHRLDKYEIYITCCCYESSTVTKTIKMSSLCNSALKI